MRTICSAFHSHGTDRDNNFLLIRLLAATLVIYGHSFVFASNDGSKELFSHYLGYWYAGDVGVSIFFVVSGFLVTASFCRRPNWHSFAISRGLRIYPALAVFVVITALMFGPLFSSLSLGEYFTTKALYSYIISNLSFSRYYGDLPVEFTGSQYPRTVAGVLWTIVIEVRLYILVGILGIIGVFRKRLVSNIVLVLIAVAPFTHQLDRIRIFSMPDNARLTILFCIGALLYVNRASIPLHPVILVMLVGATLLSDGYAYTQLFTATLIYGIFCFAFAPKVRLPSWIQDYSYGMYLYGWIVQQLVHFYQPELGAYGVFSVSLPIATACAALSWFLVEKPSLTLKTSRMQQNAITARSIP